MMKDELLEIEIAGFHSRIWNITDASHSSVVSILRPRVRIPSTPSLLFSIGNLEIVMRKGRK